MTFDGYGWGFPFGHIIMTVVSGLVSLFLILVLIGVLFLLVRFLLVATTAAKIYVARNSPPPTPPAQAEPAAHPAGPEAGPGAATPATDPGTAQTRPTDPIG